MKTNAPVLMKVGANVRPPGMKLEGTGRFLVKTADTGKIRLGGACRLPAKIS